MYKSWEIQDNKLFLSLTIIADNMYGKTSKYAN